MHFLLLLSYIFPSLKLGGIISLKVFGVTLARRARPQQTCPAAATVAVSKAAARRWRGRAAPARSAKEIETKL